jgi:ribulose-bisphosphate carboxylase large chain
MKAEDIKAFFADRRSLDMEKYVVFDYYFECTVDPKEAAAHLCQEQSTAQWKRVDVEEDFRPEFGAKVIELEVERTLEGPSYPLLTPDNPRSFGCRVKIAHPHGNFGPRLPNLLTAACGEGAYYSPGISVIKLFDIEFPRQFLEYFEGPKFGVEGLREMLDVYDRPLFFGVIKPNLGLDPQPFADLAYQAWLGGLDIAKDDEMLCDVPWSPLKRRAELLGRDVGQRSKPVSGRSTWPTSPTKLTDCSSSTMWLWPGVPMRL